MVLVCLLKIDEGDSRVERLRERRGGADEMSPVVRGPPRGSFSLLFHVYRGMVAL